MQAIQTISMNQTWDNLNFYILTQIFSTRSTVLFKYFLHPLGEAFFQYNVEMYKREIIRNNTNSDYGEPLLRECFLKSHAYFIK